MNKELIERIKTEYKGGKEIEEARKKREIERGAGQFFSLLYSLYRRV